MSIDPRPVYEADQVLTINDLFSLRNGFVMQFNALAWFRYIEKFKFMMFIMCIDLLLAWINKGKPAVFKGRYNETGQIESR